MSGSQSRGSDTHEVLDELRRIKGQREERERLGLLGPYVSTTLLDRIQAALERCTEKEAGPGTESGRPPVDSEH